MNWFRLKSCTKCQGDLTSDEGDWICLQCGTYYYTGLYQLHSHINDALQMPISSDPEQPGQKCLGGGESPLVAAYAASQTTTQHTDQVAALLQTRAAA